MLLRFHRSEEFLKYVLQFGGRDPHFRPQYLACPFCEVNFTIYRCGVYLNTSIISLLLLKRV